MLPGSLGATDMSVVDTSIAERPVTEELVVAPASTPLSILSIFSALSVIVVALAPRNAALVGLGVGCIRFGLRFGMLYNRHPVTVE